MGRNVNITLWVHQHPRVQASSTAHEKQALPLGDACFLYVGEIELVTSKALLIKAQSEKPVGIEKNHAKIVAKRNIKKGMSATPLN